MDPDPTLNSFSLFFIKKANWFSKRLKHQNTHSELLCKLCLFHFFQFICLCLFRFFSVYMFVKYVCFVFFSVYKYVFVSFLQFICLCLFHANSCVCFMRFFLFVHTNFRWLLILIMLKFWQNKEFRPGPSRPLGSGFRSGFAKKIGSGSRVQLDPTQTRPLPIPSYNISVSVFCEHP